MLLTYCINGWAWKVKVFNYNCGLSVSPFHSLRFWLLYSEIAYTFLTIMSSQWIEFSIIMYCPLSSAKNLHSEVYFYDVNSASPAFVWFGIWRYKYFHTFNFKLLAYLWWDYFFTIHNVRSLFIWLHGSLLLHSGFSLVAVCGLLLLRHKGLVARPRIKSVSPALESRSWTTGQPGESPKVGLKIDMCRQLTISG